MTNQRRLKKGSRGFTLVEMLISVAVSAIIIGGAAAIVPQIINGQARSTSQTVAVKQVENAIFWVKHDTQMAKVVTTGDSPTGTGFPLTLRWTEYGGGVEHQVVYRLEGGTLRRQHYVDGAGPTVTLVAENIASDPGLTTSEFANGMLTLKITAEVGSPEASSETRIVQIVPRPTRDL